MKGIFKSFDLNESPRIVCLDLLGDDGHKYADDIVFKVSAVIKDEWITRIDLNSSVTYSVDKQDEGLITFISAEKYSPGKNGFKKPFPKPFKPAFQPANQFPANPFVRTPNEEIRAQMLVKAAIQAISTHNEVSIAKGEKDILMKPTPKNIEETAMLLNQAVDNIALKLKEKK